MDKPQAADFKHLVRISNTDLDGNKKIVDSIRKIKGVGFAFAKAVCNVAGIDRTAKAGNLSDADIRKIEDIIRNPAVPQWLFNRRRNIEDNSSKHLVAAELNFAQENDVRQMQRIRSYRGVRHMLGLPVRGQRTRSNFRKNKGKVLGVIKAKAVVPAKEEKGAKGKKGAKGNK